MAWVYFLKQKSEAFATFKEFKALVEKQKGCSIKTIRSDRWGEYTSRELEEYCKNEGIQKQLTAGYTPQQNGVSERRNRTIVEIIWTMINEKRLPKYFWVKVVDTTNHILNRCQPKALKDYTPFEALSEIKPSICHFNIFGCICYAHAPAEKRTKFDGKSQKMYLSWL